MSATRFDITSHAVQRYMERWRPELAQELNGYLAAKAELELLCSTAGALKEKSIGGQSLWRAPGERPILFVTKPDNGKHIVVTVLPKHAAQVMEEHDDTEANEIIAAYERIRVLVESSGDKREVERALELFPVEAQRAFKSLKNNVEVLKTLRGALMSDADKQVNRLVKLANIDVAAKQVDVQRKSDRLWAEVQKLRQKQANIIAHAERVRKDQQLSMQRRIDKAKAHADLMENDRSKVQSYLRIALRLLLLFKDFANVKEGLDRIAENDPGLLTDDFLNERKRA